MSGLIEFLKQRQEGSDDLRSLVPAWQEAIRALFKKIRMWLHNVEAEGLVTIREHRAEIQEDGLGLYETSYLSMEFGPRFEDRIHFRPVGRRVIGAEGRVDVVSRQGVYLLIYRAGQWSLGRTKDALTLLDETSFEEMIKDLLEQKEDA
jgi:hypothetical protein